MKGQFVYRSALVVVMLAVAAGVGVADASAQPGPPSPPWFTNGNAGTNPTTNFLGTTDSVDLVMRTNSLERLRITSTGNVGIGTGSPLAKFHVLAGGTQTGVIGTSPSGFGVSGNSGTGTGVHGSSFSGPGVSGSSGTGIGVSGSGRVFGVSGSSTSGTGLSGSGGASGVSGTSTEGDGVRGESDSGFGMRGESDSGIGVSGAGGLYGVYGVSTEGDGVYGSSASGFGVSGAGAASGVYGVSTDGSGLHGLSVSSYGVHGESTSGYGVRGDGPIIGVYGSSDDGFGMTGSSSSGTGMSGVSGSGYGVLGGSLTGLAGYFVGHVQVTGNLSKGGGSFKIDHPLDPENKYLYHSFVESPDMMNVYNGNVTTDAQGEAIVTLPDWFEVLNKDFRYQLTIMGEQFAQARVSSKIKENRFTIKTDKPNIEVSWQVTGIRHDPYAEEHRIPVEEDKPADEKGKYLHPKEWGQPESKGVDYETMQGLEQMERDASDN